MLKDRGIVLSNADITTNMPLRTLYTRFWPCFYLLPKHAAAFKDQHALFTPLSILNMEVNIFPA
jgi:hypothetical protein